MLAAPTHQVWCKPLGKGKHAVFVLSNASVPIDVDVPIGSVAGAFNTSAATVRDLYTHGPVGKVAAGGVWSASALAPHDSRFVVLTRQSV